MKIPAFLKNQFFFPHLLVLILAFYNNTGYCQGNPTFDQNPIPPSPEAQSFMKYGLYPVDYSTGVPKIEIPIYQITSGKLSLPISLSYHASGIKVNELAGSSGLGWTVNAGGKISRNINQIEDERSFLGYHHYTASDIDNYQPQPDYQPVGEYVKGIAFGNYDGRSDDYYYSVGNNISGQFVYDKDKNIRQRSFSNNKIIRTNQNTFEIIGDDGTHYFSNDVEKVNSPISGYCPSSWMISKIISYDYIDTISFEYNYYPGFSYSIESQTFNNNNPTYNSGVFDNVLPFEKHFSIFSYNESVLIKKIKFKNGSVTFSYEGGRKDLMKYRLSSLSINCINDSGFESKLKTFQLIHSYFQDPSVTNPNQFEARLKLDEIKILDKDNLYLNSYKFHYNGVLLPPMLSEGNGPSQSTSSMAQDFWGYFNGHTENVHLVPYLPTKYGKSSDRSVSEYHMKAESLESIDFPTGGFTTFEFETNQYIGSINPSIGGLRIKKITSSANSNSPQVVKEYQYSSSTLLTVNSEPVYQFQQYIDSGYPAPINGDYLSGFGSKIVYFSDPVIPSGSHNGCPVLYSSVSEIIDDGMGNKHKTIYNYDYDTDRGYFIHEGSKYGDVAYSDKSWSRGNLTETIHFKFINGMFKRSKSIVNQYDTKQISTINTGLNCFIQVLHTLQPDYPQGGIRPYWTGTNPPNRWDFNYFDVYQESGIKKIVSTIETDYDDNDNPIIVNTLNTSYESSEHLYPTQKDEINSDGVKYITQYKYPLDFSWQSPYDAMVRNNMVSPTIQVLKYKNSTDNLLSYQKTNYLDWGNNIIAPSTVELKNTNYPVETIYNYLGYDEEGNVVSAGKSAGPITSYQWDYNKQYPTVEIKNAANTLKTTMSPGGNSFSIQFPSTSRNVMTQHFTVGADGTASLSIDFGGDEGSSNVRAEISISITGPNNYNSGFALCLAAGSASCGYPSSRVFTGLAPGDYTLAASIYDAQNLIIPINLSVFYSASISTISGVKEFYHENFENSTESGIVSGIAHTGHKYMNSSYTVNWMPPNNRNYVISYWYRDGNVWKYKSAAAYTGPSLTLTGGDAYDDICIYPSDAQITTYTYNPLVGMTSQTDAKGMTTYFDYDAFQRLKTVKDQNGNILKQIDYHYKN